MQPEDLLDYGFRSDSLSMTYMLDGNEKILHFMKGIGYVNETLSNLLENTDNHDVWLKVHPIILKKIDSTGYVEYEYRVSGPFVAKYNLSRLDMIEKIKVNLLKKELDSLVDYMEEYFNVIRKFSI